MTILMKDTLIAFFRRATSVQFAELFATRRVGKDTSGGAGTGRMVQSGWDRGFNARRTVLRTSSLKPRINEELTLGTVQRSRCTKSRSRVLLAASGHFESACCHLLLGDQRAGDHLAKLYILESVGERLIPAKEWRGAKVTAGVLSKVNRTTLAADIFEQLIGHLMSGEWKEGSRLPPERTLCVDLGVGRAALREALKALEIMGMIETRSGGGGTFVCGRSQFLSRPLLWAITGGAEKDLVQLLEARKCVEVELAGFAAERATTEHLEVMTTHIETMAKVVDDTNAFLQADFDFHLTIAQAAENQILLDAFQLIRNLMRKWILEKARFGGLESMALKQHRAILQAIKMKDCPEARRLMGSHLELTGLGSDRLTRSSRAAPQIIQPQAKPSAELDSQNEL
jgi:GntR family transcriptional repressor for pyruvate dehydrogenase complex